MRRRTYGARYYSEHWAGKGLVVANIRADMCASIYLCKTMDLETKFHLAWTGYFSEQLFMMHAQSKYDPDRRNRSTV